MTSLPLLGAMTSIMSLCRSLTSWLMTSLPSAGLTSRPSWIMTGGGVGDVTDVT